MKKKGLIVSTVVMVVVLIVALTTATFAWFSTQTRSKVDDLDVSTNASEGLMIALYNGDGANKTAVQSWTSGKATLGGDVWTGDMKDAWGQTISFSNENAKYVGVSGSGVKGTMYKLSDPSKVGEGGDATDGTSAAVEVAKENTDYFAAYIALKNTAEEAAKVKISDISIVPNGTNNANGLNGINASMRVAIYATTTDPTDDLGVTFGDEQLVCVYVPYADCKYENNAWTEDSGVTNNSIKYLKAGSGHSTLNDFTATEFGTSSDKTYLHKQGNSLSDIGNGLKDIEKDSATLSDVVLAESLQQNKIVYLRIVVWYEGTDNENITAFAGGGASISINFGSESAN